MNYLDAFLYFVPITIIFILLAKGCFYIYEKRTFYLFDKKYDNAIVDNLGFIFSIFAIVGAIVSLVSFIAVYEFNVSKDDCESYKPGPGIETEYINYSWFNSKCMVNLSNGTQIPYESYRYNVDSKDQ